MMVCINRNNLLGQKGYNILILSFIRQEAIKEKPLNLNHEARPFVMQMCFKYFNAIFQRCYIYFNAAPRILALRILFLSRNVSLKDFIFSRVIETQFCLSS